MATDKKYGVAGVSTFNGRTKIRFCNDVMRIKVLAKNGHTGVELVTLPDEMTKGQAVQYLKSINFCADNNDVQQALRYTAKKNGVKLNALADIQAQASEDTVFAS